MYRLTLISRALSIHYSSRSAPDKAPTHKLPWSTTSPLALPCLRKRPESVILSPSLRPSLNLCNNIRVVGANFVPCSASEDGEFGRQPAVLRGSLARDETHGLREEWTEGLPVMAASDSGWSDYSWAVCLLCVVGLLLLCSAGSVISC